ncbi:MAG: xanthine dehydrogenase family protein molybdopterin-binding subunit [Alphaproteobacteria bacterium]
MGQPVPRVEDQRLLTGGGRYTDDINLPFQARAVLLRSPHAHARIVSIDTSAAKQMPDVIAIFTAKDIGDQLAPLPCLVAQRFALKRPGGSPMYMPHRRALADEVVRHVGDGVAFVLAETLNAAKDAAERIEVEYEELPAVTSTDHATDADAPRVWPDAPNNICYVHQIGDKAATDAAFAKAHHVTRLDHTITRIAGVPMEPRSAVAAYDVHEQRYTIYSGCQGPHDFRAFMAGVLRIPETQLRVVSPDMGGAFGIRSSTHPEQVLALWAAKQIGRPVKWIADRSESFVCDEHCRDNIWSVELALSKDGEFLGLRAKETYGLGAYLSLFGPLPSFGNIGGLAGVYRTPTIYADVTGVFSHTTPTGPYRGAGRPEATFAVERLIDAAAREMGIDRIELRRRNMIPPSAMPFKTGLTFVYDSGAFEQNMDMAMELADVAGFAARRADAAKRGKLRGLGVVNAIEQSAGGFDESALIKFDQSGGCTVMMGTHSHGQGHETVFKQLLSERFGIPFEQIRYVQGDTDVTPYGHGTFGSRSSGLGGAALSRAADRIIEKCRIIAAHRLEAAQTDIEFRDGNFVVVGTDRKVSLTDAVQTAFKPMLLPKGVETGMIAAASFTPLAPTFPNGCHVCEVEIDPETGVVEIPRYVVVDDVGTVMNPLLMKGQMHGGVIQGIGQILSENIVFDQASGQLLSGSFMDYAMPRADEMPGVEVTSNPIPTPTNPLGIKGAGEAGCVGAMACTMNAIIDALAPLGIHQVEMPASPHNLWRLIDRKRRAA